MSDEFVTALFFVNRAQEAVEQNWLSAALATFLLLLTRYGLPLAWRALRFVTWTAPAGLARYVAGGSAPVSPACRAALVALDDETAILDGKALACTGLSVFFVDESLAAVLSSRIGGIDTAEMLTPAEVRLVHKKARQTAIKTRERDRVALNEKAAQDAIAAMQVAQQKPNAPFSGIEAALDAVEAMQAAAQKPSVLSSSIDAALDTIAVMRAAQQKPNVLGSNVSRAESKTKRV